jgi:hypothetical protein
MTSLELSFVDGDPDSTTALFGSLAIIGHDSARAETNPMGRLESA